MENKFDWQPSLASQKKLIQKINDKYKPGEKINVKLDSGKTVEWTMKHPASLLGGHTAVIWAEEHKSCYAASRVIF